MTRVNRELVFVHGRAQQHKDPEALKAEWISDLKAGLAKSDLELPIDETAVRYPFYGDTLVDLVSGRSGEDAAEVVVKGAADDAAERAFFEAFLGETKDRFGITDAQLTAAMGGDPVVGKGIQNWPIVLGILKALDDNLDWVSGGAIAIATNDVYHYLTNIRISKVIDDGVRQAMTPDVETVVVAHSLGTIVAYKLLRREGEAAGWKVPHFITLGSPLGVRTVTNVLAPLQHPKVVTKWSNAYDPHDVVALHPLEKPWFGVKPGIANKGDVVNDTGNKHGISGYLGDKEVARWIYDALTAPSGP
ncbi:hypothetical protein [Microbacterium pumilum]|uniref:Alpha/beta hydrolase n=1 Tax=Microbacterium pumilum TaxID=344165 RepID=A0ABP5D5L5_9MICO